MTSFSSDPARTDVRAINAQMIERTLGQDPQPLVEGGYAVRVLETRGRASGRTRQTPLGVIRAGGVSYLVAPNANRDWVANLDVTPDCALRTSEGTQPQRAARVAGEEAVGAISTYLAVLRVPWALRAFPVGPDADAAEIAAHLDVMAVFRLDARDSTDDGAGEPA